MKSLQTLVLLTTLLTIFPMTWAAQSAPSVPKYDKSTEAVFKGTVQEVRDRQCPVSGGMGSHLIIRLTDGAVIEVHVSTTRFVHQYEVVFQPGDVLEITGSRVKFEGTDTIFARKIKRGTEEFLFRDSDGKPIW